MVAIDLISLILSLFMEDEIGGWVGAALIHPSYHPTRNKISSSPPNNLLRLRPNGISHSSSCSALIVWGSPRYIFLLPSLSLFTILYPLVNSRNKELDYLIKSGNIIHLRNNFDNRYILEECGLGGEEGGRKGIFRCSENLFIMGGEGAG